MGFSPRQPLEIDEGTTEMRSRTSGGKLTDDDLDIIAGNQDQLEGRLQQRYGYAKDQAKREIDTWYGRQKW